MNILDELHLKLIKLIVGKRPVIINTTLYIADDLGIVMPGKENKGAFVVNNTFTRTR